MAHVRKSIRDNITTTLTGLTTTGTRVHQTRFYPLAEAKLPALTIYTKSETSDYSTVKTPRTTIRTLDVTVEAYVSANTNLDNTLDTIAVEIEEALFTDLTRGGNAKDTKITSFDADFSGDGENPVGVGRFSIEVMYVTLENDVETAV
tara:strand:- start:116 stop:559 length:444 start_codon:yes stop_codon:yes gene_type:complete